jgi:hypothetical protein
MPKDFAEKGCFRAPYTYKTAKSERLLGLSSAAVQNLVSAARGVAGFAHPLRRQQVAWIAAAAA